MLLDHNSKHLPGLRLLAEILQNKLSDASNEEMEERVSDVYERALLVDTISITDVNFDMIFFDCLSNLDELCCSILRRILENTSES